ncbi:MAG: hypothetical protein AAB521_04650 [Patescibacteria group bacterium]
MGEKIKINWFRQMLPSSRLGPDEETRLENKRRIESLIIQRGGNPFSEDVIYDPREKPVRRKKK